MDAYRNALAKWLAEANISNDERSYLEKTTKEDIIQDLRAADEAYRKSSMARSASKRMSPMVDCILQYANALDVMSNANPLPVSLIWGSMRIVLQVR